MHHSLSVVSTDVDHASAAICAAVNLFCFHEKSLRTDDDETFGSSYAPAAGWASTMLKMVDNLFEDSEERRKKAKEIVRDMGRSASNV